MAFLLSSFFFCRGNARDTKGTAFVVYEDIFDAKNAVEHLSGFNVANRYLIVLYHNASRVQARKVSLAMRERGVLPFFTTYLSFLTCS